MDVQATLSARSWLRRCWLVTVGPKTHVVRYDGRGFAHESIGVDDQVAGRNRSWLWFAPSLDFAIEGLPAKIEVRATLPLHLIPTISSVRLTVAGKVVYGEGEWAPGRFHSERVARLD